MYKLNMTSEVALYQQIVDQTKDAIVKGLLAEGDQMPSVREMASSLLVNTTTVSRAYKELDNLGFIGTVPGRGTFVSFDKGKIELEKKNLIEEIKKIFRESILYGLDKEDIVEIYSEIEKEVRDET